MNFYGIRELSNNTKNVMAAIAQGNKAIITDNGKPVALMLNLTEDNFETVIAFAQRLEAQLALEELQKQAMADFPDGHSEEEIQAEISAARKEE